MVIAVQCLFCGSVENRIWVEDNDNDTLETLLKEIKAVESLPFEKTVECDLEIKYRLYTKPISLSASRTADLPIDNSISPLYSIAILFSLAESKKLTDKERFKIFFDLFEDNESIWISLRDAFSYELSWKNLDKNNFWDYWKKEFQNVFCLGELRRDNMFTISFFTEERSLDWFEPSAPLIVNRVFLHFTFYLKNNRYYLASVKRSESLETFLRASRSLLCSSDNKGVYDKFILYNPYFKPPDPPPKETWRVWKTFLGDYEVEAEFVYFDGKFVTLMKRDGTKEKIEYKKLSLADEGYVNEAVKEQKELYEKELKELPEKIGKEQYREWITKIHDYKVEGEFVNYDGKFVTIKKRNGQTEQIEYSRLCLDDKNHVQEKMLIKKRREKK